MKPNIKIQFIIIFLIFLFSCGYETHVINTVHEDGSITRKVIVKSDKTDFNPKVHRVPIDSTWQTDITYDVDTKNDTTWIFTAEKYFTNVEELNKEYNNDIGANSTMQRSAGFSKNFRWFTTKFRFNETIEKVLTISCPMSDFFTDEELKMIYLPDFVQQELENGVDSLRIKEIIESIEEKFGFWMWTSFVRQWIQIFYDMYGDHPDLKINKEEMQLKESQAVNYLIEDEDDKDSGDMAQFFISVLGEEFLKTFETEIDSSISVLEDKSGAFWAANNYDVEIRMPGRVIASNGFTDTDPDTEGGRGILWTVTGEYFLTQTYEMWAESQLSNYWTWIVTAMFIIFVITGFVIRSKKAKVEPHK